MIPPEMHRSRDQQAKRAGGMQAAKAPCHRAQRARFGGRARAHLAARLTLFVHAFPDAVCCGRSLSTAVEITINAACSTESDRSKGLQMSRNEPPSTQQLFSAAE